MLRCVNKGKYYESGWNQIPSSELYYNDNIIGKMLQISKNERQDIKKIYLYKP